MTCEMFALRTWLKIISHYDPKRQNVTNPERKLLHIRLRADISLYFCREVCYTIFRKAVTYVLVINRAFTRQKGR